MKATLEKFTDNLITTRLISCKDLMVKNAEGAEVPSGKILATVSLAGLNAWIKYRYKGQSIIKEVDKMNVIIEYVHPKVAKNYDGFYGWIGTPGDVELTAEDGSSIVLSGTVEVKNRNLGCLGMKIPCSPELQELLGNEVFLNSCDGETRIITVPDSYCEEVMDVIENLSQYEHANSTWEFIKHDMVKNNIRLEYRVSPCKHNVSGNCTDFRKVAYYPRIHVPYPEQNPEEAGTALTRFIVAATAGLIGKLKDPAYPSKAGVRGYQGKPSPYFYSEEKFPNCQTCIMCKYVRRGNDDESEMGQSSIAATKTDGIDPVYGCRATGDWIEQIYKVMSDLNGQEVGFGSPLGKSEIRKAGEQSACELYMWRERYVSSTNSEKPYRQQSVWHSWTPATKAVEFIDGEQPSIQAKAPTITLVLPNLPEAYAVSQRNFKIV